MPNLDTFALDEFLVGGDTKLGVEDLFFFSSSSFDIFFSYF